MSGRIAFSPEALVKLRQERAVSQSMLSRRIDRPIPTIRSWERSKRVPPLEVIGEIADALGVEYTALITRAEVAK
ncbi:helix-turn-helix domain-containing protein [Streptomyces cinereoruber]|uniref:helix-turn-helix domain-containing protein n=1 Tax=Streptomyces cinereoruber TaxID=67260 RepID=UPI00339AF5B4